MRQKRSEIDRRDRRCLCVAHLESLSAAGGGPCYTASLFPFHFIHFLVAIMKAILSLALVLGVSCLARAADKADPVGTWKCEYEIGGQKRTSTLTIKKDG